jgi:glycosyltransferase involved in cell wall biosynthesis
MKISIGILAHNEEAVIASMIDQTLRQDLFFDITSDIQFIVVANGCTDQTVHLANQTLMQVVHHQSKNFGVKNIELAGKSNAWNKFVHEFAWLDAEYLILLDADIDFGSTNVLSRLIVALEDNPKAVVSVDRPKKGIEKQLQKGLLGKLSVVVSSVNQNGRAVITGQLYCMRGETIRNIYMPVGLPCEDGFLRAMVVTSNFTHEDDSSNIITVNDVCHYFEALLSPGKLYRHEKRLIIGSAINMIIYTYLWSTVAETGKDAGFLIKELNENEPRWLIDLIDKYKSSHGFWIVDRRFFFNRILQLISGNQKLSKKVILFPTAVFATFVTILIAIDVNCYFRKNNGLGHW